MDPNKLAALKAKYANAKDEDDDGEDLISKYASYTAPTTKVSKPKPVQANIGGAMARTVRQIPFVGDYLNQVGQEAKLATGEVMRDPLGAIGAGVAGAGSGLLDLSDSLAGLIRGGEQQLLGIPEEKRQKTWSVGESYRGIPIVQELMDANPNAFHTGSTVGGFTLPLNIEGAAAQTLAGPMSKLAATGLGKAVTKAAGPAMKAAAKPIQTAATLHPKLAATAKGALAGAGYGAATEAGALGAQGQNLRVTPEGVLGPAMLGAGAGAVHSNLPLKGNAAAGAAATRKKAAIARKKQIEQTTPDDVEGMFQNPHDIVDVESTPIVEGQMVEDNPAFVLGERQVKGYLNGPTGGAIVPPSPRQRAGNARVDVENKANAMRQAQQDEALTGEYPQSPAPPYEPPYVPQPGFDPTILTDPTNPLGRFYRKYPGQIPPQAPLPKQITANPAPIVPQSPQSRATEQALYGQVGNQPGTSFMPPAEPAPMQIAKKGAMARQPEMPDIVDVEPIPEPVLESKNPPPRQLPLSAAPKYEPQPEPAPAPVPKVTPQPAPQPVAEEPKKGATVKAPLTEDQPIRKGGRARDPEKLMLPEEQRRKVTDGTGQARIHKFAWNRFAVVDENGRQITPEVSSNKGPSATYQQIVADHNAKLPKGGAPAPAPAQKGKSAKQPPKAPAPTKGAQPSEAAPVAVKAEPVTPVPDTPAQTTNHFDQHRAAGEYTDEFGNTHKRNPRLDTQNEVAFGHETNVTFRAGETPVKARWAVVPVDSIVPSHTPGGGPNPKHFIPEAQPKNREVSTTGKYQPFEIAKKMQPELMTEGATAYNGAPVVNQHGEVIQGNGRAMALHVYHANGDMYGVDYPMHVSSKVEGLGIDKGQFGRGKVLVRVADVPDTQAIKLGQHSASDVESAAGKATQEKALANQLTDDHAKSVVELLNAHDTHEDKSLREIVRDGGNKVLDWLQKKGILQPKDAENYFKEQGRSSELTEEGVDTVEKLVRNLLFKGADPAVRDKFDRLPANAQKAIDKAALHLLRTPGDKSITSELSNAISGYADEIRPRLESGDIKSAAEHGAQTSLFGKKYTDAEYSLMDLLHRGKQGAIASKLKEYANVTQDSAPNLLNPEGTKGLSKDEAMKKVFGIEPEPKVEAPKTEASSGKGKPVYVSAAPRADGKFNIGDFGNVRSIDENMRSTDPKAFKVTTTKAEAKRAGMSFDDWVHHLIEKGEYEIVDNPHYEPLSEKEVAQYKEANERQNRKLQDLYNGERDAPKPEVIDFNGGSHVKEGMDRLYASEEFKAMSPEEQKAAKAAEREKLATQAKAVKENKEEFSKYVEEQKATTDGAHEKTLWDHVQEFADEFLGRKGVMYSTLPGVPQVIAVARAGAKVVKAIRNGNIKPEKVRDTVQQYMGLMLDHDHLAAYKPSLATEWFAQMGDIDKSTQGLKMPETVAEREAMLEMRRIIQKFGVSNGARIIGQSKKLANVRPELKKFAVDLSTSLKDMGSMFEKEWQELDAIGEGDSSVGKLLRRKYYEVTGRDVKTGNDARNRPDDDVDWLGKADHAADNFYRMVVTGNWHIHTLHAADAAIMGPAYFGGARYAKANTFMTDKTVREWAMGAGSKGIYGASREDSIGLWDKHVNSRVDALAAKVTSRVPALKGKGKFVEGGFLENEKTARNRIAAILKIGDDTGIGGEKLLNTLAGKKGANVKALTPDQERQVRGQMMRMLAESSGVVPYGVKNKTALQRIPVVGKVLAPFTGTLTLQSRAAYRFISDGALALSKGDHAGAIDNARGAIMFGGMIVALGGPTPIFMTKLADAMDPVDSIRFRSWLKSCAVLSKMMGGRQIQHIGIVEHPFLYATWDNLHEIAGDIDNLAPWGKPERAGPAALRIMGLLADGMTIGNLTSVEQLRKVYKAMKEGAEGDEALRKAAAEGGKQKPTKTHSTYSRSIADEHRIRTTKVTTNTTQEMLDVLFPHSNAKEAIVDFNANNAKAVRDYGLKQYPSQSKVIRRRLTGLWKRYEAQVGDDGVMPEIPADAFEEILRDAKEAAAYESETPAE